ncbi:MAG: tRNA uridine-5-carboxymethylaminomethyl(34) synthesis GTPase MnmE [Clostridia bacterium]|nr:tRNA uridine-5-carboxymethylaminomethyl(34) synthesis GTPase MnmE [Clostridia bacterium]
MHTIAAISTPYGKGGIAVIRVSGDTAMRVADAVFRVVSGKAVSGLPARFAAYGEIISPLTGEILDTGVCVPFQAPASFTGEDVVEISCHGGTFVTASVLSAVLAAGAEPALPGEFTKRAFINGKLSLTEAEAVGRLIDADTEERMRLSSGNVRGLVSGKIAVLSEKLLSVMTALYAAIDYPEEDVGDEGEREIAGVVAEVLAGVENLLSTYKTGRAVAEGVKTVLCGRPNAGKSSLFNRLTGCDSAIVTDIAGTTRDILRETVSFGGVTLRLSDTAGLREAGDTVEQIGVERAGKEIGEAELVLAVLDPSQGLGEEEQKMFAAYPTCPRIAILNKSDTGMTFTPAELAEIGQNHTAVIPLSCATGEGMDALRAEIARLWGSDCLDVGKDAVIWDVRQHASLTRAAMYLREAAGALAYGDALDAICTVCESALASLNETDGRGVTEEIVDEIFKRFCVGK